MTVGFSAEEDLMNMDQNKTVREWVREVPVAASVFEEMGIEYCCGGDQTLERACAKAHQTVAEVEERITNRLQAATSPDKTKDWGAEPLADLMAHIIETHHAFTRRELERLAPLARTVARVHAKFHPELARIQSAFDTMSQELSLHMMKEEQVLFPYIARIEEAAMEHRPVISATTEGVENPVAMMMSEHESAAEHLHTIRDASANYNVPSGGCLSYLSLYQGLQALERDLHQHISLENNILFPRALRMEAASRNSRSLN